MRVVGLAALCALASLSLAATAAAQPTAGTAFVSGAGFAAVERPASTSGPSFGGTERDGTAPGGALGVGVYLTDRVSARVEVAMSDWIEQPFDYGILAAVSSPSLGTSTLPAFVPDVRQSARTTAVFSLLGYHVGQGRVSLETLAGLGLVDQRSRTRYDVRGLGLPAPASTYTTSTWVAAAVVGADVRVTLTDHAALVPQVRAYAASGGLSVRPGLALRWTF